MSSRTFFRRSQPHRSTRRATHGRARRRACFETLEDRSLLSLTPAVGYDVGSSPQAVVAADFNNDGQLDLATANVGSVSVLLGNANGTFDSAMDSPAVGSSIAVGDFDGDGNLDLAGVSLATSPFVKVMFGNGHGSFHSPTFISLGELAGPYSEPLAEPMSVAVGDFNEDQLMDIAVAAPYNTHYPGYCCGGAYTLVKVILSHEDRTFSPLGFVSGGYDGPGGVSPLVVTDFNGDGHQDAVVGFGYVDGYEYVRILLGDGEGSLAASYENWSVRRGSGMAVGDVDGDGVADLVTAENANVNVRLGNGTGGLQPPPWGQSYPAGDGIRTIALGDFDHDEVLDVVFANNVSNSVGILRGRGDGSFAPAEHFVARPIAAADFNGDDFVDGGDLAQWRGDFGANPNSDADSDGDSDGSDFLAWQRQLGSSIGLVENIGPVAVTTGDFNGDGWVDVATANVTGSSVSVLLNNQTWGPVPLGLSVSDATVTEGNSGAVNATFTLNLSAASAVDVTVQYDTEDVTAAAGSDYFANSGNVVIPAGQTIATFTVAVLGDRSVEPTETFAVRLSAPTNAGISDDGLGIATILDNEPWIGIDDVSHDEGGQNTTTLFSFTLTLSVPYDQAVTLSYSTSSFTARAGSDFQSKSGQITFAPGETTKTISIQVYGDNRREGDETFYVDLFHLSSNSLFTSFYGIGTILNDDA